MNWGFFHSQPNWWLTHTHHAIRIFLLAVCTRIYCDFGVKGTEKSFRKMTWEFQKSCMPLYKTMETRAHWVAVWSSSPFRCCLPIPSHLSVSYSLSPLGIIKLVTCMSSLKFLLPPQQLLLFIKYLLCSKHVSILYMHHLI